MGFLLRRGGSLSLATLACYCYRSVSLTLLLSLSLSLLSDSLWHSSIRSSSVDPAPGDPAFIGPFLQIHPPPSYPPPSTSSSSLSGVLSLFFFSLSFLFLSSLLFFFPHCSLSSSFSPQHSHTLNTPTLSLSSPPYLHTTQYTSDSRSSSPSNLLIPFSSAVRK